jgi:hypothetical protein
LEIHVPPTHSAERPAIRFSHVTLDLAIEEHPLAHQLPKTTGERPSISRGYYSFTKLGSSPDQPLYLSQYLTTDEPLIFLYVTTFTDATLVSITLPHAITDLTGTADMLRAWSCVLSGRVSDVIPVLGAREDVYETMRKPPYDGSTVPYVLQHTQVRGISTMVFEARRVWDTLVTPNLSDGFIFLPAKFISQLRREAEEELETRRGSGGPSFVSDGDLITAWGSRMVVCSRSATRSAVIVNVFNLRTRLSEALVDPTGAYVQNLIMNSSTILQPGAAATESSGQIAIRVREALITQTTEAQVRSLARLGFASGASMPLFGRADSMIVAWTNWSKARLAEAAAGLGTSAVGSNKKTISPVSTDSYMTCWGADLGNRYRDGFVIFGKNDTGDYWLHGSLRAKAWDLIRTEFKSFV